MYLSLVISLCLIHTVLSVNNISAHTEVNIENLPVCWAERLAVEGILARCLLHRNNLFLHCNFCVIENGRVAEETSGRLSYDRMNSPETCEFVYFPTQTGIYRFEVGITGNYSLQTNDIIISELPELCIQQACRGGFQIMCSGIWFRGTPFIKMSSDDLEINEMTINRFPVAGRSDTYFSVASVQLSHSSPTKVTCHAMYMVRSFTKNISVDFTLKTFVAEFPSHISFQYTSGKYLPENISITHGTILQLQCSSSMIRSINLSLNCRNAQGNVLSTYGESPILFYISVSTIGNFTDVRCKCRSHPTDGCYDERELLVIKSVPTEKWSATVPVFKDKAGSIVNKLLELAEGTNISIECVPDIVEVTAYNVTVTCWNQEGLLLLNITHNSHPVKFLVTGDRSFNMSSCTCNISFSNLISINTILIAPVKYNRSGDYLSSDTPTPHPPSIYDTYSPAYYILTGVITFFFFPFIVATIVYVYLYWREVQRDYVDHSNSCPTHSNEYESIRHSPQSSNAASIPAESCALLEERSSPYDSLWNSDSGGSSRSNPYFMDTSPDIENRSSASSSS